MQLHVDIPVTGGCLLETGIEHFLKLKIEGKLDHDMASPIFIGTLASILLTIAPVIVVFTKYDLLVVCETCLFKNTNHAGKLKEAIGSVRPFDLFVQMKVPHIMVSKYWEHLFTSVNFPRKKLQQCLNVIHTNIIAVWQFDDPQGHLSISSFKALMSNIVASEGGKNKIQGGPAKGLATGISLVTGIAGIVSAISGPAVPIVIAIATSFVLAKWAYNMYQQMAIVLKVLMSYIIDLTLVLQNIFWLQVLTGYKQPLSCQIIKAGAHTYYESNAKQTILFKINEHLKGLNFNVSPNTMLNTIVELIESCTIDSAEMLEQRSNYPVNADIAEDEALDSPWMDT
ncbi:hypothetical protein DXG01_000669 [Tephrocybe rancida]|nr:hypothetical protein DXG01_000669 [Tephrocybe rancida]